ncbi:MAG: ribonuclease E/G [Chlamydiales bacterium]|nr:ribonuclease E/G [Chlamydiales bacterium]
MKEILLNCESKEIRYAILHHGSLQDLVIERKKTRQLTGNIYKGKVINILKNIQSAFIDINEGDNGFIHITDILENTQKFQEAFDMDFDWGYDISQENIRQKETDITALLKKDQPVLVQVVKEPIGTKGARLTSNISLPGRYLVMLPNNPHRGVSRKIQDKNVRDRLKKIIRSFEMPKDMGLICRTASITASTDQLIEEATELCKTWHIIIDQFHKVERPTCLYQESDIIKKAMMTAIDKKYDRLLVDDYTTFQICQKLYKKYNNEHDLKIDFYRDKVPMFEKFSVEREIDKATKKKIWLPSGGYLFFERTEAMHTIDVNSGRSNLSDLNVEETLVHINMEAAIEIARQLRIRNIGGLVICDFIDMRSRKNQRRVLDSLKEAMKDDSAKCTILGMSEFGLVEMTRQRSRESLAQTLYTSCPYCSGRGIIKTQETVSIEIERALKRVSHTNDLNTVEICTHPHLLDYMHHEDKEELENLGKKAKITVTFSSNDDYHLNEFSIVANGQEIEV